MPAPTTRYAAVQASYWSAFCMIILFASAYLLDAGLSNGQVGAVIACGGGLSAVLQPVVAGAADRSRRVPLRVWAGWVGMLILVVAAILVVPGLHWLLTAVFFGLMILSIQLLQPLVNALGMGAAARGIPLNFGIARAAGSATFALVSVVAGWVVASAGTVMVPLLVIAFQALFLVATLTFVSRGPATVVATGAEHDLEPPSEPMTPARWRRFFALLAGITLSMTSHAMINNYMLQIMRHHGGDTGEMGTAIMIAAITELPVMVLWSRVVARWTPGRLLQVAGVFFTVKTGATWLAAGVVGVYAAQVLQTLAFAVMVMASVYYVERILPARDRTRGQAFMTMTSSGGSVLGSLTAGVLLDATSVPAMLLVGTLIAAVGAVLTVVAVESRI
ncbi:MFS transporter [Tessaracoccus lubricantis]